MECFNCKSCYNDTLNPPHFLIECGHSLCNRCLKANFNYQTIICPECKTPNRAPSISSFPKNLALLYFKPPLKTEKSMRTSVRSDSTLQTLHNSKDSTTFCTKHCKTLEAFCENDRQLLCIACVLQEGYKDRDTCTIQEAAEKERGLLNQAAQVSRLTEDRLKMLRNSIIESTKALNSAAEKAEQEVLKFFQEIKGIISERENALKREIFERYKKEEEVIKNYDHNISIFFNDIEQFNQNYEQSLREDDISLLSSSIERLHLIKRITTEPEDLKLNISFEKLDKAEEVHLLCNMLSQLDNSISLSLQSHQNSHKDIINILLDKPEATPKNKEPKEIQLPPSSSRSSRVLRENRGNWGNPSTQTLNGAWGTKRGDKASKLKKILNGSSVEKREITITSTQKTEPYERIALLDHQEGRFGNSSPFVQKPYTTRDSRLITGDQSIRSSIINDSKMMRGNSKTPKAMSTSIATINLHLQTQGPHENPRAPSSTKNRKMLTIETPKQKGNCLSERMRAQPKNTKNKLELESKVTSNTKSEIKMLDSPSYSSFHTNIELLDIMNTDRKNGYLTGSILKDTNAKKKPNLPSKSIHPDKENMFANQKFNSLSINQESICFTQRDNYSILLKSDLQSPIEKTDTKLYGRRYSELTDLTANKFDLSALCLNVSSYVYIIGGFAENPQMNIERLDLQKGQWEVKSSLPSSLSKFSTVILPDTGNILLLGGKEEGVQTAKCLEYCMNEDRFKPSNITLTIPKSGFGSLIIKDEILICGGSNGKDTLRSFESYSLTNKKWKALPPLKHKRHELALAFGPDQKIYAIGGLSEHNGLPVNIVERYDPETKAWEDVAYLNTARTSHSIVTLPDGIYAIGGHDGYSYLNTVEKYDDTTNTWMFIGSLNYPRCRMSAVVSSDLRNIYVFGGYNNGALNSVERYSVISDRWEMVESMKTRRFMHCAVLVTK